MKHTSSLFFSKKQFFILALLAAAAFITKFIVAFHPYHVIPRDDELYYLFFSENLRLVYPDHTPMVAYFLAFAKLVFNSLLPGSFNDYLPNSLALVPISSTIYFLFLYAFIYFLIARVWKNKPLAFLVLFSFLLTPYLWGVSFLTTPETPLTFFAFPAVLTFAHAFFLTPSNTKVWLLAGFFLAGAFLGKILAIPLGISIAAFAFISPKRKSYLSNYRFYLAFLPSLIAGLLVLYGDSLDDFSMIKYLFDRNNNTTSFHYSFTILGNQFVYYTPLFFLLVLFLPVKNIYAYLKKNSFSFIPEKTSKTKKDAIFFEEILFFLAVLSTLCTGFFLYKMFTIRVLNWWGGFTAAPNILFMCLWLQQKMATSQKNIWRNLVFANFLLAGVYCIFASFQGIYGVLDPNYTQQQQQQHPNDRFPAYNTALNKGANFLENTFGTYPQDFGDWLHKYYPLTSEFKNYYNEKMDKNIPIVGVNFRPSLYIHYYVQPKNRPMALTIKNSDIPLINRDLYGLFHSLFHLDMLANKSFYLVTFHHFDKGSDKNYEQNLETLKNSPYNCTEQHIFYGSRVGKLVSKFPLYFCQNNVNKN